MKANIPQWSREVLILVLILLSVGCAGNQQKSEGDGQISNNNENYAPSRNHIPGRSRPPTRTHIPTPR